MSECPTISGNRAEGPTNGWEYTKLYYLLGFHSDLKNEKGIPNAVIGKGCDLLDQIEKKAMEYLSEKKGFVHVRSNRGYVTVSDEPQEISTEVLLQNYPIVQIFVDIHAGEWFLPNQALPRYISKTSAVKMAHSRHEMANQIEYILVCSPVEDDEDDSWDNFDELVDHMEIFYQKLDVSYRVRSVVSKKLDLFVAKKYVFEVLLPFSKVYREVGSVSHLTDFVSRSSEIRFGAKKQAEREKRYVHMIHGILCDPAVLMSAICERYQTSDGIHLPSALSNCSFQDPIAFAREAKKDWKKTHKF
eukprot:TRINITY_DN12539_c0_g1_i1.p1 TRINITY_DN12539_c0_g1~~TRINITY_DN12539_c0_g1_i1.p1  ORF type:complete len:302 (-),score=60.71 TRINITY_DN12539_c0_g1_i1:39-944(-)